MYRLGFVPNQGGILAEEGRRLHKLKDYDYKTSRKRLASILVGIGDGESIDRSSSPTSLTNIRYNFTSRHGQKKELHSVGLPTLTNASFLFSEVYNKEVGEAGFEPT